LSMGGRLAGFLGFSVAKPLIGAPDTRETAMSTLDMGMKLINTHGQTLLDKDTFQFKGLAPRTEDQRQLDRLMRRGEGVPTPGAPGTPQAKGTATKMVEAISPWVAQKLNELGAKAEQYISPGLSKQAGDFAEGLTNPFGLGGKEPIQPTKGGLVKQPPPGQAQPPQMSLIANMALKSLNLTAKPDPKTDAQGFTRFMGAIRQHLAVRHPELPADQLDTLISNLATQNGGTWQPAAR